MRLLVTVGTSLKGTFAARKLKSLLESQVRAVVLLMTIPFRSPAGLGVMQRGTQNSTVLNVTAIMVLFGTKLEPPALNRKRRRTSIVQATLAVTQPGMNKTSEWSAFAHLAKHGMCRKLPV